MMCENITDGGATQVVDLRSDFVARPTPAMVEAMLRAARQPCGFGLREDTIVADLDALHDSLRHSDAQHPRPAAVAQENTHVRSGGRVVPTAHMTTIYDIANSQGVPVHLDGARIFNAAVASGIPARDIARTCDTVSFNLNKGLGAPLGAILAGPDGFIAEAVRIRQMFGGGWRPAGIVAAAGIVALETMIERLHIDHTTARQLANGLSSQPTLSIDKSQVESNIVLARPNTMRPETLAAALEREGVLVLPFGDDVRLVTHHEITENAVEITLKAFHSVLSGASHGP